MSGEEKIFESYLFERLDNNHIDSLDKLVELVNKNTVYVLQRNLTDSELSQVRPVLQDSFQNDLIPIQSLEQHVKNLEENFCSSQRERQNSLIYRRHFMNQDEDEEAGYNLDDLKGDIKKDLAHRIAQLIDCKTHGNLFF